MKACLVLLFMFMLASSPFPAGAQTLDENDLSPNIHDQTYITHARSKWEAWFRRFLLPDLTGLLLKLINGPDNVRSSGGPIQPPDVFQCHPAELPPNALPMGPCCLLPNSTISDFKLPPPPSSLRIRRPAHAADPDYIAKYAKAIALMKALPDDDPRNFNNQARVHCAYCNSAYNQLGFPDVDLQIHGSWLFLPWHRWFIYFHERILGNLIGDPTFAIPFWNWDSPAGMGLPLMYAANSSSPLYIPNRDATHQPSTGRVIDLNFNGRDESHATAEEQIDGNLKLMYRQMVSNGASSLFLGGAYRAGDHTNISGSGSIEISPHGQVHAWTGDGKQRNREHMGTYYSAGFDPIFFAHHCNLDRLWHVWKGFGGEHKNYQDVDYLESSFMFYDENAQLVRVKIRDCLDEESMGYTYEDVDLPWLTARPTPALPKTKLNAEAITATSTVSFPVMLGEEAVSVRVKRSAKKKENEVLVVEGIEVDMGVYVKFDVHVNAPPGVEGLTPAASQFAGSFVSVPHRGGRYMSMSKKVLKLGITDLLEDLEAERDDSILVTLVARSGKGKIIVGGIHVELNK